MIRPGGPFPALQFESTTGQSIEIGGPRERWQLVVVYRGKHCGRCKPYLDKLESLKPQWQAAGFDIVAISADTMEKAQADVAKFGWTFPVCHGLGEATMRELALHVSDPASPEETDRRFAEPGVFCLRPDGTVQIMAISNGPSARPDLAELLDGMTFTIEHARPPRGMA